MPIERRGLIRFAILAALVPLGYALFTGHVWEDFFITFRHSLNLVMGRGLVYNPPERVHGFTSPLGALLPALFAWLTGSTSFETPLWLFRMVSIAAYVGAGLMILGAMRDAGGPQARCDQAAVGNTPEATQACRGSLLFALLYLFEAKSVMFSVNGMETAFMLLFLAWALAQFERSQSSHWIASGLAWAGLMWTRPDGFIYIGFLAAANLIFARVGRWRILISLGASALVCAVLYAPWYFAAREYYGSAIPQTVFAKAVPEDGRSDHVRQVMRQLWWRLPDAAAQLFQPIYFWDGEGWLDGAATRYVILGLTWPLGIFCCLYWLLPIDDRLGRAASFGFAWLAAYFAFFYFIFPWYMPPALLLGLVTLARGGTGIVALAARAFPPADVARVRWLVQLGAGVLIAYQSTLFALTTYEMRVQEREVEMGNRRRVGEWLRGHASDLDRVYLEPAGYIGYFSGRRILDYPGLVSPGVVECRRRNLNMSTVIPELRPEWLVLRPKEMDALENSAAAPYFHRAYNEEAVFDVRPAIERYGFLPGRRYVNYDACFHVFRERPDAKQIRTVPTGQDQG